MASVPTAERPPPGLGSHWLGVWRHALKVLKAQETWAWEQSPLLAAYVYALREADSARILAEEDPYHLTDKGLLHPHPGFQQADRAMRRAALLAQVLLLTPAEQKRIVTRGDSDQPDTPDPFAQADELAARRRAG